MLRNHKKALIASSLLTLLPIAAGLLLWDRFPEKMITHWGFTGEPDGWSSVPFAVFFPPLIMLAVHWLCIFLTAKDPGNKNRNRKPLIMVLWIIPFISNLSSGVMYALALGADFSAGSLMIGALGLMFAVIGNYLPKCRMNSTIGIKVPWAYSSEENWNATHRFGGKCWVIGGIVTALGALIPGEWGITVMIAAMIALCVVPIVYSYRFYKKELAEGKVLTTGYSATDKKILKASGIFVVVILIFVAYMMFAGEITYDFREDYLFIDTNMYTDHIVYYDVIESMEFREGNVSGSRVGGYGSARLLMGYFQNEEFGTFIRYTYTDPGACIVLHLKNSILVLSAGSYAETQELMRQLQEHIS